MITREFGHRYGLGCDGAPPPLHVYSADAEHAAWHPLAPPYQHMPVSQHPGPVMVRIPVQSGDELGHDPTAGHRILTCGMIGRFHEQIA